MFAVLGPHDTLDFSVKLINFLQGQTFGLVDEKMDESNTQETAGEPDEENLGLQIGVAVTKVDEVRGCVGDCPVEKPLIQRMKVSICAWEGEKKEE